MAARATAGNGVRGAIQYQSGHNWDLALQCRGHVHTVAGDDTV